MILLLHSEARVILLLHKVVRTGVSLICSLTNIVLTHYGLSLFFCAQFPAHILSLNLQRWKHVEKVMSIKSIYRRELGHSQPKFDGERAGGNQQREVQFAFSNLAGRISIRIYSQTLL